MPKKKTKAIPGVIEHVIKDGGKKLSAKRRKLIQAVFDNPDGTLQEWGDAAGYNKVSARQKAHHALKNTTVRDIIRETLDKSEATTIEGLTKTLVEGLKAKETKFFSYDKVTKIQGAKKGEPTEKHERVIEARDTVDYATRHRYMESGFKLHGGMGNGADEGAGHNGPLTLEVLLGQAGGPQERDNLSMAFIAIRVGRGLHPHENRPLTPDEAKEFK